MTETVSIDRQNKCLHYLSLVTVEPTMVFYMMAFMTTTVLEQMFFLDRACRVDHGLNATICDNFTYVDDEIKRQVHITVSNFGFLNDVAGHAGQIILALFMGAWSDKRGRKWPLLIGLVGKLYYSSMIVVNTMYEWPLDYVVYTATLPMAFTGADVAIFAAAFTYLVDITTPANRTIRVTVLEVCYLATMPLGIKLGSFLFNKVTNKSYTIMFLINVALLIVSIIYSWWRLEWRTTDRQRPLAEAPNMFRDFFDFNHVIDTGRTVFRDRLNNRRTYLLMLIVMMGLYTFQRDEKNSFVLYVNLVFDWGEKALSDFKTVQSAIQDVVLLVAIPLMSKVLGWRDTIIIMIGALAHAIARGFYANAAVIWVLYVGGVFAAVGPIVAPVIRSMVSKMVAPSEKGKVFSILSVADNAIPIVSGGLYSKLYNATIHTHPNAIFYLTMATQIAVFILISFIHFKTSDNELVNENEEVKRNCLENDNDSINESN